MKISLEDKKAYGDEKFFTAQPTAETRRTEVIHACNWYNYICDKKQAKVWTLEWLKKNKHDKLVKEFGSIKDSWVPLTIGWYSRLDQVGLELTSDEAAKMLARIEQAIVEYNKIKEEEDAEATADVKVARPNIQEIMIAKAHEAGGEIDGLWDEYLQGEVKATTKPEGIRQILAKYNILAQHVSILKDQWMRTSKELQDAVADVDADLSEGYSCWTKTQQKNMINYCAAIVSELDAYHQSKKAKVGVRKKKPVSPEKQVSKLKYMRKFDEFKLESVEPTRIIKASELWVYNTKNRKLQYYVADDYAKVFSVKGTSILGFDTTKSSQKTLRKPQDILKELRVAGKPDSRKLYDAIKTTSTAVNGRFNESMIIVKAT